MLKKIALIALPVVFLSGCSIEEVAQTAADAAACQALQGTLSGLQTAYAEGLVDSGVLTQIDVLVGDQLDALLSTGLADDLRALIQALGESQSATAASEQVNSLTSSITERCVAVGVVIE
jgi:hypothetical protein